MNSATFTILLGGSLIVTDRLETQLSGSRFIAADGGMRHAAALGVTPELWVGDFDSTSGDLAGQWPDVERQPYPARKAQTDGEIAVGEAIARGAGRLILLGALGGERLDHALMHLMQALRLAKDGHAIMLTSGDEEAYPLLPGRSDIDLPNDSLFSVLGFSQLEGLSIDNARYPLADFALPFGSSRTISNVANGPVSFSLQSGEAMLLARPFDLTGT